MSYEANRTEVEEVLKYADGHDFFKAEDELRELEEQLDEDTFNILHQFNDRKVVIISLCSYSPFSLLLACYRYSFNCIFAIYF